MSGERSQDTLGLQQWSVLRKAPWLEKGRNGVWHEVLSVSHSIFGIKDFQQYISYKTFKTLFLLSNVEFMFLASRDMIWFCLKQQWDFRCQEHWLHWKQNLRDLFGESIEVNGNIHLPQRKPDNKDDSVASFFTFSVHISQFHRTLPTMKVPNCSVSTFSFPLFSSLRSHTHFTQYLKYRKAFFIRVIYPDQTSYVESLLK